MIVYISPQRVIHFFPLRCHHCTSPNQWIDDSLPHKKYIPE
ncbi:hypothetical protein FTV88_2615 [Heliorestis convoluta]|uniref:Uncharacterized protein n=1 Tax=Heliorestis convoluta TaxID=356322 RepID=A0A5Q2N139_9FIRM|nr:hypothetical protein FTV88_2615 [Heliorestis convoluta]